MNNYDNYSLSELESERIEYNLENEKHRIRFPSHINTTIKLKEIHNKTILNDIKKKSFFFSTSIKKEKSPIKTESNSITINNNTENNIKNKLFVKNKSSKKLYLNLKDKDNLIKPINYKINNSNYNLLNNIHSNKIGSIIKKSLNLNTKRSVQSSKHSLIKNKTPIKENSHIINNNIPLSTQTLKEYINKTNIYKSNKLSEKVISYYLKTTIPNYKNNISIDSTAYKEKILKSSLYDLSLKNIILKNSYANINDDSYKRMMKTQSESKKNKYKLKYFY